MFTSDQFDFWGHEAVSQILVKSDEWVSERAKSIGGSDANILVNGDVSDIIELWKVKRGEAVSENLDDVLAVQFGTWTEPLNRYWFTHTTGREITGVGRRIKHKVYGFMHHTLDGLCRTEAGAPAIWEAKTVNAFWKESEVVEKYMPQLHHGMLCCGVEHAVFSVFLGTMKHVVYEVELDHGYAWALVDMERAFWESVENGTPPAEMPKPKAPVPADQLQTVDMEGSNEWATAAADWLENKPAAKKFDDAGKAVRKLVPDDVGYAFGHGIEVNRSKSNSLLIKASK